MEDLEIRVQRLEDREAIRSLKHHYAELCDQNYAPEALAALFTIDGVWDGGEAYGRYEGREEIAGYWRRTAEAVPFAIHFILNHVVEPYQPGYRARGHCNLFQPMTLEGRPYWAGIRYEEEYVNVGGDWLFGSMHLSTLLLAPHAEGW